MCLAAGVLASGITLTSAQDQQWRMPDPLVEIDLLDPPDAPIRRYALTARHAPVREVPIPESQNLFCTLSLAHNVVLNYYRDIDTWVFQIDLTDDARRAAGGLATLQGHQVAAVDYCDRLDLGAHEGRSLGSDLGPRLDHELGPGLVEHTQVVVQLSEVHRGFVRSEDLDVVVVLGEEQCSAEAARSIANNDCVGHWQSLSSV